MTGTNTVPYYMRQAFGNSFAAQPVYAPHGPIGAAAYNYDPRFGQYPVYPPYYPAYAHGMPAINPVYPPINGPYYRFDITGTWETNWGSMTLAQSGMSVSGNYGWDQGRIEGTLEQAGSEYILDGYWSEAPTYNFPNDKGKIRFIFTSENSFAGNWSYGDVEPEVGRVWKGDRKL